MSHHKFLFILGAGASCKESDLPLSKDLAKSIIKRLSPNEVLRMQKSYAQLTDEEIKIIKETFSEAVDCANESLKFKDIDTYAKYLYIMEDFNGLEKVKKMLALFFTYQQIVEKKVDDRYSNFLIGLLEKKNFPKERVSILTWNYDYQLELAASNFWGHDKPTLKDEKVNYSKLFSYPSIYKPEFNEKFLPNILHLNGIAGIGDTPSNIYGMLENKERYEIILRLIKHLSYPNTTGINFAWEENSFASSSQDIWRKMLDDVTILVCIGYSFPFYNRIIDNQIYKSIVDTNISFRNALVKIYIQDPVNDGSELKTKFQLPEFIEIEHIKDSNFFHIPYEY